MVSEEDNIVDTSIPVLSNLTYREWHAFANGFYVGLTAYADKDHEYIKEKHYWRGGFIAGWGVKIALVLSLGPWILAI